MPPFWRHANVRMRNTVLTPKHFTKPSGTMLVSYGVPLQRLPTAVLSVSVHGKVYGRAFIGSDPNLKRLRAWAPTYRRESWFRALADHGVSDLSFAEQLSGIFLVERRERHVLFCDTENSLTNLRKDYQLALVTNGAPDLQREKIQGANLTQFFDTILISGEVGIGKPDCRIFELALDALGALPSETVMIGDSLTRDILGAQRAGLKGIWLNRSGSDDSVNSVVPDAQVTSFRQINEILLILAEAKRM